MRPDCCLRLLIYAKEDAGLGGEVELKYRRGAGLLKVKASANLIFIFGIFVIEQFKRQYFLCFFCFNSFFLYYISSLVIIISL